MRTLVTGATGFVGPYLAEALLAAGDQVVGLSRRAVWPRPWAHLQDRVPLIPCDLGSRTGLDDILARYRPQWLCHLAGYAQTGRSYTEPEAAWEGNLTLSRRLFEAVARFNQPLRVLFVSTGLVYGDGDPSGPAQDESHLLQPVSPYAASKAAADLLAYQVTRHPGLDVVRARPFNHIGPGQGAEFAIANFARQISAIKRGEQPPLLETGDLRPARDLCDVRDVVAAYLLLLKHGRSGVVYNIARGESRTMQEVLDRLIALSGCRVEVRQRIDPARVRDVTDVRADASRLRRDTGWEPRFSLDQSLGDILAFWDKQR
jgi:GDP-4-dehydro-6-deoxy-D-mannose reductase